MINLTSFFAYFDACNFEPILQIDRRICSYLSIAQFNKYALTLVKVLLADSDDPLSYLFLCYFLPLLSNYDKFLICYLKYVLGWVGSNTKDG